MNPADITEGMECEVYTGSERTPWVPGCVIRQGPKQGMYYVRFTPTRVCAAIHSDGYVWPHEIRPRKEMP